MQNSKKIKKYFSINIIEQGRLSNSQTSQLIGGTESGGSCDLYKATCPGTFIQEPCALYTYCYDGNFPGTGYVNCPDKDSYTICPAGVTPYKSKV